MRPGAHGSGATGSTLTHLEGGLSRVSYPADELATIDPLDGRPLLARYDLDRAASTLRDRQHDLRVPMRGVWRWHDVLPVRDWSNVVTLGEGSTPLLEASRLGRAYGISRLLVKTESLNPTGSFKARGMTVAVSCARELGATSFVMPSAGNAGGALAAYAGVADMQATVVMPSDAPTVNQVEVAACGADLILVDGLISDCGRLTARIAEHTGAFNLSTLKEPYRVEGKKTMGIELAEDLGWSLPDVIVYPMGGGTGLIGMWKAFAELEEMGMLGGARPRMIGVQVEGCAPLVRAFLAGRQFAEPWADATTAAAGLRVPSTVGDFLVVEAIRASGGTAIAVPEAALVSNSGLRGTQWRRIPEPRVRPQPSRRCRSSGVSAPWDRTTRWSCSTPVPGSNRRCRNCRRDDPSSANEADWESLLSGYAPASTSVRGDGAS